MRIFEPKKILVPIDFSEVSFGVLQAGVDIGRKWDAEVMALHVARESDHIPQGVPSVPAYPYASLAMSPLAKFREDARSRLEAQLETMLKQAGAGPRGRFLVLWGAPARDIVQMAGSENFDLIVMATHGRRGLNRMFLGSVTEEVIRRAPCPVFSIRIKGQGELQVKAEAAAETTATPSA